MPVITQGKTISSTAQIVDGIVETADLADGAVTNVKVGASAAIAQSKLSLSITNNEVNAAAAIADTKLATISTAGKVSGAALTSLASIPSGAGVIPAANLPPSGGITLEGEQDTEGTGVGGGAVLDVLTIGSLSIATGKWIRILCAIRHASGSSSNFNVGMKINGTQVIPDTVVTATSGWSGIMECLIGPRQANYQRVCSMRVNGVNITEKLQFATADIGTATITEIILMGSGPNGANTVGYKNAKVLSYADN